VTTYFSLPSSFPRPPSLTPHSPTHLQPEGLRKEMESQAQLLQQHRCQTPSLQNFNIPKRLAPAYVSTEQHLHGVNYNRGSASGRGPTGGDQRHWRLEKNDRDRITLTTGNSLSVHSSRVVDSRQNLDANQSNYSYIRWRTRIPRITYACMSGISGVYKESRVATEPFGLGLAKV